MLYICSGCVRGCAQLLSHSLVLDSLGTHGLQSARLCCPWNFPGKNTGGGLAISFSRGNFLTQGSNLHLLHWQEDSLPLCHLGSPNLTIMGHLKITEEPELKMDGCLTYTML